MSQCLKSCKNVSFYNIASEASYFSFISNIVKFQIFQDWHFQSFLMERHFYKLFISLNFWTSNMRHFPVIFKRCANARRKWISTFFKCNLISSNKSSKLSYDLKWFCFFKHNLNCFVNKSCSEKRLKISIQLAIQYGNFENWTNWKLDKIENWTKLTKLENRQNWKLNNILFRRALMACA